MVDLVASIKLGDLDLTSYPYAWEFGGNLGKPELVTQALQQQLQDGEVVSADRSSNRQIVINVLVEAADLAAQADAESALALECAKARNTLTYDPGDGVARPTVFDTFVADMSFDRDDTMEQNGLRRWVLTIPALPFARSADLVSVTVPAPPGTLIDTTVDSGSSATGWAVAPSAGNAVQTIATSTTWTAPTGITSVTVEAEGGGGGGSGLTSAGSGGGGGGGGGAYASSVVAVTPGTGYAVVVGAGGVAGATLTNSNAGGAGGASTFGGTTVKAAGGSGAPAHTEPAAGVGGAGGTVANSIGTTRTAGGAGGGGYTSNGGFNVNGGAGGAAAAPLGSTTVGAGGSGDGDFTNAAAGKAGQVRLTYDGKWTVSSDGSNVLASKPAYGNTSSYLERTGLSQSLATAPYIKVKTSWTGAVGTVTQVLVNGTPANIVAQSGGTYYIDGTGLGTLNSIRFELSSTGTSASVFMVDQISVTNSLTGGSTGRQNARQIPVTGSARSQASLSLADTTPAALGTVLVYSTTDTSAHQPPLRTFLQAGPTVTVDSSTVSGSTSPLATVHYFNLPASGVPAGAYLLLARVKPTSAASQYDFTLTWGASSVMNGVALAGQSGSQAFTLYSPYVFTVLTVGLMNLPPTEVGPSGTVQVSLYSNVALDLDEAWLFNMDTGRLTWVECGTGTPSAGGPSNRLWLDTASVDDPKPSMWRGTSADRKDAVHAGVYAKSWGLHDFTPPSVNVFTVTSGSTAAALELDYFPRWHTHVGSL